MIKIYNFITKIKKKYKTSLIILILIILFILIYCFYDYIFVKDSVYYYTFSTIVQGFIGLIAFLGAVVVFKLQIHENEINKVLDVLRGLLDSFYDVECQYSSNDEIKKICEEKKIVLKDSAKSNYIKLTEIDRQKGELRSVLVDFVIITLINVSMAIFGLLFVPIFQFHVFIGTLFLLSNIFLSIFSLYWVWRVVRVTLGYSFELNL
jgi:hypothetical protein